MKKTDEKMKACKNEEWLNDFKGGEEHAFRVVFDEYYKILCYFAFQLIKDEQVVGDLVQEVFVNLWQSRETITSEIHVRLFLYQALRRRCLNWIRDRKAETEFRDAYHQLEDEVDYTNRVVEEEIQRIVLQKLALLPSEQRRVMELHLAGKGNAEIADVLKISVNTVRTHKARARKTLRGYFDRLFMFLFFGGI